MWLNENCRVIIFLNWINEYLGGYILEYLKKIFTFSHRARTYIVVEPSTIPIKVGNVKRSITIEPLSAVICNTKKENFIDFGYSIAEPIWLETVEVFPYSRNDLCGTAKTIGLDAVIKRDDRIGIPYLCIDSSYINRETATKIINGGFIELENKPITNSRCRLEIKITNDWTSLFMRSVLNRYINEFGKCRYCTIDLDKSLYPYCRTLVSIDKEPIVVKIGKGYIFSTDIENTISLIVYTLLILTTFTKLS
ncbi:MAG: hypothetical protein QW101_05250 [Ignisphaera sp.]|uniref:Uncharacterized protein n=1 Tax=Ignisphaera aggregans TaxID=334771 RepID=A0A7J3MZT7_9CREN